MAAIHTACDAAGAHRASESRDGAASPRLTLLTCILASSLAFIDGSVVNVGLPAIGRDLKGAGADLPWVVNAYLLPLSALLLFGGALGDRYGRRRLLVVGTGVFALASLGCAAAPSLAWLLLARGAQGAGAALLMPNSLAILGANFEGEARGRAIGVWASTGAVMGAVGPVLGGWLIDAVGWRSIFLVNLPIALAAIALALACVRDPAPSGDAPRLDLAGAALATAGLGAATWGLTVGAGPGGWTAPAYVGVLAGLALLAAFVALERRLGDRAMMPLSLFGSREFVGLTLLTLLLYGALGALLVLIPFMLIVVAHWSAVAAGAALLPFPIVLSLTSPVMGGLAGRIGGRWPLTVGPVVVALGFLLATRIDARGDYWRDVLPAILVIAFGMAGAVAPLTTAVLGSVDARHTGSASGFNSAVARGGGLVATALLGAVLAARGAALVGGFRMACLACAASCLGAGVSAFLLLGRKPQAAASTTTADSPGAP